MSTEVHSINSTAKQVLNNFLLLLQFKTSQSHVRMKLSVDCTALGGGVTIAELLALIRLKPGHKLG